MFDKYEEVEVISGKWAGSKGSVQSIEPFEVEVLLDVKLENGSTKQFSSMMKPGQLRKISKQQQHNYRGNF